jgi:hypothetical protein
LLHQIFRTAGSRRGLFGRLLGNAESGANGKSTSSAQDNTSTSKHETLKHEFPPEWRE